MSWYRASLFAIILAVCAGQFGLRCWCLAESVTATQATVACEHCCVASEMRAAGALAAEESDDCSHWLSLTVSDVAVAPIPVRLTLLRHLDDDQRAIIPAQLARRAMAIGPAPPRYAQRSAALLI